MTLEIWHFDVSEADFFIKDSFFSCIAMNRRPSLFNNWLCFQTFFQQPPLNQATYMSMMQLNITGITGTTQCAYHDHVFSDAIPIFV